MAIANCVAHLSTEHCWSRSRINACCIRHRKTKIENRLPVYGLKPVVNAVSAIPTDRASFRIVGAGASCRMSELRAFVDSATRARYSFVGAGKSGETADGSA